MCVEKQNIKKSMLKVGLLWDFVYVLIWYAHFCGVCLIASFIKIVLIEWGIFL